MQSYGNDSLHLPNLYSCYPLLVMELVTYSIRRTNHIYIENGYKDLNWLNQRLYNWYLLLISSKYALLRRKSRGWLTRTCDNVSEWSVMFTCGIYQLAKTIKIQLRVLIYWYLLNHFVVLYQIISILSSML
jgi:hypothetical protein